MAGPSETTIRRLFALSGNLCAFPDCSLHIVEPDGTITGEICHIRAHREGGPRYDAMQTEEERHGFGNLALLCRRHHKLVDAQPNVYSAESLLEIKALREREMGRPEQPADGFYAKILLNDLRRITVNNDGGNVAIDSPGAIQAQTINVKTTRKTVKINAPPGTIGADQTASRYIQYLINRYNEFASADKTRASKFSFGAISKNIESNFGSPWRLLPIEQFSALCGYLQQRVSKTRVAKLNTAKGHRSFSTFEEFTCGKAV